jgi:hypothetical protein
MHGSVAQQVKIPRVEDDFGFREFPQISIEHRGSQPLETRLAGTFDSDSIDEIVTLPPFLKKLRNRFGGLEIGIHDKYGVTAAKVKTCGERKLMAKISAQLNEFDPRVILTKFLSHLTRVVAAAIIDANNLQVGRVHSNESRL